MAEWKHGLFGCFDNPSVCIMAFLCPCVSFGKVAESVGESCFVCGLCFMIPPANFISWIKVRGKVRETKGIEGGLVGDLAMYLCCAVCAIIQMAQEVEGGGAATPAPQAATPTPQAATPTPQAATPTPQDDAPAPQEEAMARQ